VEAWYSALQCKHVSNWMATEGGVVQGVPHLGTFAAQGFTLGQLVVGSDSRSAHHGSEGCNCAQPRLPSLRCMRRIGD